MVGDELQKFAEGNESAVPGVIATPKSAAVIDEHMQDQYFCTNRAEIVFKEPQRTYTINNTVHVGHPQMASVT